MTNTGTQINTTDLWNYRASKEGWFVHLVNAARSYQPHPALEFDTEALLDILFREARREADWLYHPCTRALWHRPANLAMDANLLSWLSVNVPFAELRSHLHEETWSWSPRGGVQRLPGEYRLCKWASQDSQPDLSEAWLPLDPWARSIGHPEARTWASVPSVLLPERAKLSKQICAFYRVTDILQQLNSTCADWVRHATRVVIPLLDSEDGRVRSTSRADLPGVIFTNISADADLLDSIIHESAHQHFYLLEAEEPLVERDHETLYFSPLRAKPRPLRGVYLAFHALVYIRRLYQELADAQLLNGDTARLALEQADRNVTLAAESLEAGYAHLTRAGRRLFAFLKTHIA